MLSGIWAILYYGSALLLPLLVAAIIAALLDRPTEKFKKWGFPHWLAMTVSLILMSVAVFLLFWLISSQIGNMADDWPTIKEKATEKYGLFGEWTKRIFQIDPARFVDNDPGLTDRLKRISKLFVTSLTDLFAQSFIILIYTVLFLMQKRMFMRFFKKMFKNENAGSDILTGPSRIIGNYMFGKGIVMFFLFIVYYLGFTLGGVNVENKIEDSLDEISTTAIAGIRFLTPYLFNLDVRMDSMLRPQISLSREVMVFPRTAIFGMYEYQANFGWVDDLAIGNNFEKEVTWNAGIEYFLSRNLSLMGSYDNRFGAGGGLSIRF